MTEAAYVLFDRKGFEATTIDEIADAVEVSPRTFLRYFNSKEDVALTSANQQLTAMIENLAARPSDESVLTALRRSVVEVLEACETGRDGFDRDRYQRTRTLLARTPTLLAASLEQSAIRLDEVATLIGQRMGVDHTVDRRPYLVAAVALNAVQTGLNAWRAHHPAALASETVGELFDLLGEGIDYPAAVPPVSDDEPG